MAEKKHVVIIIRCREGHIVDRWLDGMSNQFLSYCGECGEEDCEPMPERSITTTVVECE
jgi:hypothetical protein